MLPVLTGREPPLRSSIWLATTEIFAMDGYRRHPRIIPVRRLTRRVRGLQNNEVVRALETIVALMEIKDESYYRVLAYQRAAESVGAVGRPVREVEDLETLPHVGATTAAVIRDLAEDRTPQILAELSQEVPTGLVEVTRLPGVGPRTAGRLWRELGVTSVEGVAGLEGGSLAAGRAASGGGWGCGAWRGSRVGRREASPR